MNRGSRARFVGGTFAALLAGCAGVSTGPESPKQMVAHQLLVTVADQYRVEWSAIRQELAGRFAMMPSGEFPLSAINVDCLVYKVPDGLPLQRIIDDLRADRRVVLAQENQIFQGIQGENSDNYSGISYAPKLIHADTAHQVATGKGVAVAIIDTGAEMDHPDLKGRVVRTDNFVEGGEASFNADRHGTAIAGVVGARADDGVGIAGVAPNADVSVYKACWYADGGDAKAQCSSWSLAKALDAAINNGARIINLSLAGPPDPLLGKLLEAASQRGIHIVAAALEKHAQPGFPADMPEAIPVISTGPDGRAVQPSWLAGFPQTVAAPGVEVLTTVPKQRYDFLSGSSLATAHVSGVLALLLEVKADLSPKQVKALLGNAGETAPVNIDACALLGRLGRPC